MKNVSKSMTMKYIYNPIMIDFTSFTNNQLRTYIYRYIMVYTLM